MADGSGVRAAGPGTGVLVTPEELAAFRLRVRAQGAALYRDLPWRRTRDPYAVWVSEVMLQQTQVARVDGRWQRWMGRFPTVDALASASTADVLEEWQGMGYNRRALSLLEAARILSARGGTVPRELDALVALPGVGPATAAGIRAFAFDLPGVYLETNVRAVFLHELLPGREGVTDRELVPLVRAACPSGTSEPRRSAEGTVGASGASPASDGPAVSAGAARTAPPSPLVTDTPRSWYLALLDVGAHLKRTVENPSRRSAAHVRQSRFEGSRRQKRAELVRLLLDHREGATTGQLARELAEVEARAGRPDPGEAVVAELLRRLADEGFCYLRDTVWVP